LEKRKLGRSDIEVSVLSLGCWPLAGGSGWGDQSERSAIATIHAALEHGISFFDTAEGYENGVSEEIVGKALADRRDRAIIGTKVSPDHTEPSVLCEYVEAALRRLRTDYVDVYHVHWPIRTHSVADTFAVLQQLKDEGKIRAIGVSNFGPLDLADALTTGVQIDANQLHYSLLSRAIEYEILPLCREKRVGVTTYMPLMQGLLTGKYETVDDVPPFRTRTRHFSGDRPQSRHGGPGAEKELFDAVDAVRADGQRRPGLGNGPAGRDQRHRRGAHARPGGAQRPGRFPFALSRGHRPVGRGHGPSQAGPRPQRRLLADRGELADTVDASGSGFQVSGTLDVSRDPEPATCNL
jgi:myo-inositol catabolism protein IolS